MGFRELVEGSMIIDGPTSVDFQIREASEANANAPIVFNKIKEVPGHRVAINILTRKRLCESFGISPGELIDILSWAMDNPVDPQIIDSSEAPVLENTMSAVDLELMPIPWHYPEDGGRYQSSSIIIAQYAGQRNTSFHRQLTKGNRETCVRLVPVT